MATAVLEYLDIDCSIEYVDLFNRYSTGSPFQAGALGKMPQFPPLWEALNLIIDI